MKKITDYIIHRSLDMNQLVIMVQGSMQNGYQPFGNLIAIPIRTNLAGDMELNGQFSSIAYMQSMVTYEEE